MQEEEDVLVVGGEEVQDKEQESTTTKTKTKATSASSNEDWLLNSPSSFMQIQNKTTNN